MKFNLSMTSKGIWTVFRCLSDGKFQALKNATLKEMTISQLMNGPYISRFTHPEHGQYYFVTTDNHIYQKLIVDGKTVGWLHELVESYRAKECADVSDFYEWDLVDVQMNQTLSDEEIKIVENE